MVTDELADKRLKRQAGVLGFAGLLPFAAGAFASWLGIYGLADAAVGAILDWVLLYGAIILSFMGGGRWGAAIRDSRQDKLLMAVLPALVAWVAVIPKEFLPSAWPVDSFAYGTLGVAFILILITEFAAEDWPDWYLSLRLRLTLSVVALLVVTGAGRFI